MSAARRVVERPLISGTASRPIRSNAHHYYQRIPEYDDDLRVLLLPVASRTFFLDLSFSLSRDRLNGSRVD